MNILLIKPPINLPDDWKGITFFDPPIGLAYIASVLKENGHNVDILDAGIKGWNKTNSINGFKYAGLSFKNIQKYISIHKPDIVGITSLSVDATNALEIAQITKKVDKNIKVVLGGAHICVRPKEVLSETSTDFIVTGEGEYTMLELVQELQQDSQDFSRIKGLGFKDNGTLKINPPRQWNIDLDNLPLPAYELLNFPLYAKAAKYLQGSRGFIPNRTSVITSRGCPYACNFCSINTIMGKKYRYRSAENVINEIEILVNEYGITDIGFEDDNVSLKRERFEKICDLLIDKNISIRWDTPNGIRADTLDEPLLKKMKKSGCTSIILSPEVGDQYILDNIIGKKLDLKKVEEVTRICQQIDLPIGCFFMIGLIGENKASMQKTVEFSKKLRSLGAKTCCFIAQPYYGTKLYHQAKKNNALLRTDGQELERGFINMRAMIKTPEFCPEDLYKIQSEAGAGLHELKEILGIVRTRPFDAIRCFWLHPAYISKYLIKNHIMKKTFMKV